MLEFEYSEKATKFEKIFHLKFDVTEYRVASSFKRKIFSNFMAFSKYLNFIFLSATVANYSEFLPSIHLF